MVAVRQTTGCQCVHLAFENDNRDEAGRTRRVGKGESEGVKCQTYVLRID